MPSNRLLTPQQKTAKWLIEHPAEFGRRVGFTKLRDDLHGEWIKQMLWRDTDQTKQAHRGSYKTSCLEVAMALLCMTQRDKNVIFLRKTDNDVAEVMQAVQSILLHPLTQAVSQVMTGKPLELYTATNKKITTSYYAHPGGAPQILGIGVGGSLTGKHGDIIITDDIVNRLDRQSRAERERTKLIYQELQNLRNPGGRFINTGTPWHKEDAFSLMPTPEKWDCYQTGLLSKQKIEELRMQMAPSLFAANYELRHIASDGALFDTSRPIVPEENEEGVHLLRNGIAHIDAAYGGEDYTAFTCCQMAGGKIYIYGKLWHSHGAEHGAGGSQPADVRSCLLRAERRQGIPEQGNPEPGRLCLRLHGEPEQVHQDFDLPEKVVVKGRVRRGNGPGIHRADHGLHGFRGA